MIPQPSSSRSTLSSHADHQLIPHSLGLRRLLSRLDKSELIALVKRWLSSSSPSHIPPMLSRRQPKVDELDSASSNLLLYHAILDLNEERRARSLDQLRLLWIGPMADPKVPKARAIDRITEVDWPEGLSYGMIAELDLHYMVTRRFSKTWITVKMEYEDDTEESGNKGFETLNSNQVKSRLCSELGHYFQHHVYLHSHSDFGKNSEGGDLEDWAASFSYFRVVLAPAPADVCGTGLHILHVPRTPFLLVSGSLGRGSENREIALSAFASAAGANTINYPKPTPGSASARRLAVELNADGVDAAGNKRNLGELKGKDPLALRNILLNESGMLSSTSETSAAPAGVAGGGKSRAMRSRQGAEDGPLVAPAKRRREEDLCSLGVRLPTPPASETGTTISLSSTETARERDALTPLSLPPNDAIKRTREAMYTEQEGQREASELFGRKEDLPKIERLEYELHLPFPEMEPYNTSRLTDMDAYNADPDKPKIKLRLEGTHVLEGLRKLVEAGMDRSTRRFETEEAEGQVDKKLDGLPGWMTEVRGTRVTVKQSEAGSDTSRDI